MVRSIFFSFYFSIHVSVRLFALHFLNISVGLFQVFHMVCGVHAFHQVAFLLSNLSAVLFSSFIFTQTKTYVHTYKYMADSD